MSLTIHASSAPPARHAICAMTDEEIVEQIRKGEVRLYETIMRRYNRRLYRLARAILRDDIEAEDIVQETYLKAFTHLGQFAGRASFGTWLMKIAINESRKRAVRRACMPLAENEPESIPEAAWSERAADVEHEVAVHEVATVVERMIDALPEQMRIVFVMREIEQFNPAETAHALGILEITVRTRLHRARRYLRRLAYAHFGDAASKVFEFGAERCDHIVANIMCVVEQC